MNVMKFALNDNQKVFIDSQGLNFRISFYFFQKLDLGVFVDLEKFQPWYLRSELWSPKSSLYMDYCNFALGVEAKGFSWLPGDKFLISFYFSRNLILVCLWT